MTELENSEIPHRLIMAEEIIAEYVQKFGFTIAAECYFLSWNDGMPASATCKRTFPSTNSAEKPHPTSDD